MSQRLEINGDVYRLNAHGQVMHPTEEKVAVAVSYGYGSGWSSSWNYDMDPTNATVLCAKLEKRPLTPEELIELGDPYLGGYENIEVEWVDAGKWVAVEEFDGAESLRITPEKGYGSVYLHYSPEKKAAMEREARDVEYRKRHLERWDAIAHALYKDVLKGTVEDAAPLWLCVGKKKWRVSGVVARTVPYFEAVLKHSDYDLEDKTVLVLDDVSEETGWALMEFLHRGTISRPLDNGALESLRRLAERLMDKDLVDFLTTY